MSGVEITRGLPAEHAAAVRELIERETARLGYRPLADQLWLDLTHPDIADFASVTLWDGQSVVGYGHGSAGHSGTIVQLVGVDAQRAADILGTFATHLTTLQLPAPLEWLVFDSGELDRRVADEVGLQPAREVVQMRRPLPLLAEEAIATRPFRVGVDDDAWLAVNARAFASHAEQGSWDHVALAERQQEPWFDPAGFLIHEIDGQIAGFCWTKIHTEERPPVGEIYVIAVDPVFHGRGLGRALVVAGLHAISARGVDEAMLYVDGDNAAALSLYTSLGFTSRRVDRVYAASTVTAC